MKTILPMSIKKPVSDCVIRGNKYHRLLNGKLSPARRRHVGYRLHRANISLKKALKGFMSWGIQ